MVWGQLFKWGLLIVSNPHQILYEVTVVTGDIESGGTDASIFMTVFGSNGNTEEMLLEKNGDRYSNCHFCWSEVEWWQILVSSQEALRALIMLPLKHKPLLPLTLWIQTWAPCKCFGQTFSKAKKRRARETTLCRLYEFCLTCSSVALEIRILNKSMKSCIVSKKSCEHCPGEPWEMDGWWHRMLHCTPWFYWKSGISCFLQQKELTNTVTLVWCQHFCKPKNPHMPPLNHFPMLVFPS